MLLSKYLLVVKLSLISLSLCWSVICHTLSVKEGSKHFWLDFNRDGKGSNMISGRFIELNMRFLNFAFICKVSGLA
jgi:hypothetical protein